jgi:hypothetical protein
VGCELRERLKVSFAGLSCGKVQRRAKRGSASRLDVNRNLLHDYFTGEAVTGQKLDTVALVGSLDLQPLNDVLSIRILSVQPQRLDSRELKGEDGLARTNGMSRTIHGGAQIPCVNPNHGEPTAIDVD